jgi:hypothetical protein
MRWFGVGFGLLMVGVAVVIAARSYELAEQTHSIGKWIGVAIIVLGGLCQMWAFLGSWLEHKRNVRLFHEAIHCPDELARLSDQLLDNIEKSLREMRDSE